MKPSEKKEHWTDYIVDAELLINRGYIKDKTVDELAHILFKRNIQKDK